MPVLHKESCPTCGQSVNPREIQINAEQVRAFYLIYAECKRKGVSTFTRKELKKYLTSETLTATFGDLRHTFLVTKPKKGLYEIDMWRASEFFAGRMTIPTKILKDPLAKTATATEVAYVHEIRHIRDMLDENGDMIVRYEPSQVQG